MDIRLIVPSRFNVDVRTGGGGIDIDDLEGNVLAQTSGGGIDVGYIRNGSVDVRTSGGGIEVAGSTLIPSMKAHGASWHAASSMGAEISFACARPTAI